MWRRWRRSAHIDFQVGMLVGTGNRVTLEWQEELTLGKDFIMLEEFGQEDTTNLPFGLVVT